MSEPLPDDILDATVRQFIASTAAKSPTPGGGSVAALAGALAASLAEMSLQYTVGKKGFESVQSDITAAIDKFRKASGLLQDLVYEDIAAYKSLSALLKLPKPEREKHPEYLPAVVASISAPMAIGGLAMHILELSHELLPNCNPYLLSDLGGAAALAHATVHIAELNVLVNLRLLPNPVEAEDLRKKVGDQCLKADMIWHKVRETLLPKLVN